MTHLGFVREFLSDGVHPNLFVLTAMRLAIAWIIQQTRKSQSPIDLKKYTI